MFKSIQRRMKIISLITALIIVLASLPVFSVSADPTTLTPAGDQFNIVGAIERYTINNYSGTVNWVLLQVVGGSQIVAVSPGGTINAPTQATTTGTTNYIDVQSGQVAEATIQATLANGTILTAEKKWGQIDATNISCAQTVAMQWSEPQKTWSATATVTDEIIGSFVNKDGVHYEMPAGGAVLNWFLIQGTVNVPMTPAWASDLLPIISALPRAIYAEFSGGGTATTTTSGNDGLSSVSVITDAEEAVQVVVVATYPTPINVNVFPEVTSINFYTVEWEKVPQVAWSGDKVVVEKNFGTPNALVRFSLENQSPGTLEGITAGAAYENTTQTVWTRANNAGVATCIVHSEDPGEVDVLASMWASSEPSSIVDNQHAFVVYFMKFEDITLGNVEGERAEHNTGVWTPPNPFDAEDDVLEETLNVSADTLLRANVRGWFLNAETSTREARTITNGPTSVVLPAGRWILPDDWAALAGVDWQTRRMHWDIMDSPSDSVRSTNTTGPYNSDDGNTVGPQNLAANPKEYGVTGPFTPGIEEMTPTGYKVGTYTSTDPLRKMKTVVPNGTLDKYDAPMPPAKIIFKINAGPGYFKAALKSDIYYIISSGVKRYTSSFYQEMIPAHPAIPAFINNGGYDWSSFGNPLPNYGPYPFWQIINQPSQGALVTSYGPILPSRDSHGDVIPGTGVHNPDWAGHPTKVEVYSDNHGEAMVYVNGFWNLNLSAFITNGAYDVPPGTAVGTTTVQALADYPYLRKYEPILSNTVAKTWEWGKQILGTSPAPYPDGSSDPVGTRMVLQTGTLTQFQGTFPNQSAMSDKKMAWVWVTNPDGFPAVGEQIDWTIEQSSGTGINIPDITGVGVSNYNDITMAIATEHGFLAGTGGYTLNVERTIGRSWTRLPTEAEEELFEKFYPYLDADDFAVAAVEITSSLPTQVDLQIEIHEGILGTIRRHTNLDFSAADPADDPIVLGDANQDGNVNVSDIIMVERMILGLAPVTTNITSIRGSEPDMGHVVWIERRILGK